MRLFWAIELPETARDRLRVTQAELRERARGADVRWSRPEQLHLTVQFLGEADPAPILAAAQALPRPGALDLEVAGLGTFGGRRPRVVWAGVRGPGLEALVALAGALGQAMAGVGFAPEARAYRPHVTLGRVRQGRGRRGQGRPGKALKAAVEEVALEPHPFRAEELVLLRSSLGEGRGPVRYAATGALGLTVP
jgi:2'-5' RNA ligase